MRKLKSRMTHMLRPEPELWVVAGLVLETRLCTLGRESLTWTTGLGEWRSEACWRLLCPAPRNPTCHGLKNSWLLGHW